jgi:hypothetical protein
MGLSCSCQCQHPDGDFNTGFKELKNEKSVFSVPGHTVDITINEIETESCSKPIIFNSHLTSPKNNEKNIKVQSETAKPKEPEPMAIEEEKVEKKPKEPIADPIEPQSSRISSSVQIKKDIDPQLELPKTQRLPKKWGVSLSSEPEDQISLSDYSRNFFNSIHKIRKNPEEFLNINLPQLLKKIQNDQKIKKFFLKLEHFTFYFKSNEEQIKSAKIFLESMMKGDSQKLEDIKNSTLWSEKVYKNCLNYLKLGETEEVLLKNLANNFNYECDSGVVIFDGLMDPDTAALLYLIDNPEKREFIFCHSFDVGGSATVKTKNGMRLKTALVLVDIIYPGERERRAGKKVKDQTTYVPTLSLDHPALADLTYKDEIVDGEFTMENGKLVAVFTLEDGQIKNVNFNI